MGKKSNYCVAIFVSCSMMKPIEDLLNEIITDIGVPIPKYSYELLKFTIELPGNVPTEGGGVTGGVEERSFDTFRDACYAIIVWSKSLVA